MAPPGTRAGRLALIPARSGSKRLPGKNVKPLGGHPLIAWTIKAALASGCFDRVVVSTDSAEIARVSTAYGAEAPFLRPQPLATDAAATIEVVLHALDALAASERYVARELCLLQPTSPYRNAGDIVKARELLEQRGANAVISVAPCAHPPAWSSPLGPDGSMEHFLAGGQLNKRSQALPPCHRLNGAIYWYRAPVLRECRSLFPNDRVYAYEMDELRSVDIDTPLDFEYAEFLLERGHVARP
jgi:CMP-N-acetylneuraminic acid synthetase